MRSFKHLILINFSFITKQTNYAIISNISLLEIRINIANVFCIISLDNNTAIRYYFVWRHSLRYLNYSLNI